MTITLESIPRFAAAEALAVAARDYGVEATAVILPSERDQNFKLTTGDGKQAVLKIANADDDPGILDFQNEALRHVARSDITCEVPKLIPTAEGHDLSSIRHGNGGPRYHVRLLSWVEGDVLGHTRRRDAALLESIGSQVADLDRALANFAHPAMHRSLQWDVRRAGQARDHVNLLPEPGRQVVEQALTECESIDWSTLRHSVIHSDANDYNVVVRDGLMTGLLDFGDMVYSATVCDLAIALAYALQGEADPLAAAVPLLRGYQSRLPLTAAEETALLSLLRARLSMSVCYAAHNRARNPEDSYQTISEAPAWALLEQLREVPPSAMLRLFRAAGT